MPWALPDSERELLRLAKSYPFDAPAASYLFRDGAAAPLPAAPLPADALPADAAASDLFAGRTPVIAHGSNRAPAQLRRKFGDSAEIPVSHAWLGDHDVVYSAHLTRYGSVAANLHHVPGARVEVFVTWLTEAQLARMHETELGSEIYAYGVMERIDLRLEAGPAGHIGEAHVYISTRGCLPEAGAPLGLAAVAAEGRPHGALDQDGALALVRDRHRPDHALDDFILTVIRDAGHRKALIAEMGEAAVPTAVPHFRVLRGPGRS